MALLSRLTVRMEAQTGAFITDMDRAARASKRTGGNIKKNLAAGAALAGAALARAAIDAAQFEKAMAEVSTLVDTSKVNMADLERSVLAVSKAYGGDAPENAKALYQIISAGAEAGAESNAILIASNKLAVGGVTELETAADGLTTVMNAYGLNASEAGRVSDIMFGTMKAGKTTIGELSGNFGTVVTLASTAGVSFEELSAGVAALTKVGIGTSESMTALRGVLSAVAKGSEQSMKMAKELGVEFSVSAIKSMGFANWLQHVAEKSGMSESKLSKLFGRVEGLTAVLALGKNGGEEFNAILRDLEQSAGATDEAFAKMEKTAAHQWKVFTNNLKLAGISIGQKVLPVINRLMEGLQGVFGWVSDKVDMLKEMNSAYDTAAKEIDGYTDKLKELTDQEKAHAEILAKTALISNLEGQIRALNEKADAWFRTGIVEDQYRQKAELLEQQQQALYEQLKELKASIHDLPPVIEEAAGSLDDLTGSGDDAEESIGEIIVTAKRLGGTSMPRTLQDWFSGFVRELDPAIARAQDFALAQNKINEMIAADPENKEMYLKWLDKYQEKLDAMGKKESSPEGYTAIMKKAWESLDQTFQDVWTNLFENGKISLDGIKSLFLNTLAQMAHHALTRPIVMRMGAQMGFPGAGDTGGSGGLLGGASSLLGKLMMPLAIGSMIGGNGSPAEQWGSTAGAFGGMFATGAIASGIGALAHASGAFAALLSGIGGQALNFIIPVIGPVIGALLGKVIGKMLKRDPEVTFQGSNYAPIEEQSLFGGFDVRARGETGPQHDPESFAGQAIAAIQEFDDALGAIMTDGQISKIVEAMKGWRVNLKNSAVTIENILESRFKVVLSTFSKSAQDYVNGFSGLEERTQALAEWLQAFNAMSEQLAQYVTSTLPAFNEVVADARNSTQKLSDFGQAMRDAFAAFDGTPETMRDVAVAVNERYRAELEYLAAIDQLITGMGESISKQKEGLQAMLAPERSGQDSITDILGEAWSLMDGLATASSPEEIARIVGAIQSMVNEAQGLAMNLPKHLNGLPYPMRAEMSQADFVDLATTLLASLEEMASGRALELRAAAEAEAMALREEAAAFAEAQQISLDEIVSATSDTVGAINDQTGVIREGNDLIYDELVMLNGRMLNIERIQQAQYDLSTTR